MPMEIHEDKIVMRAGEYNLPKPWVGLTNEEIIELWAKTGNIVGFGGLMFETIRAVETKLKEKNT